MVFLVVIFLLKTSSLFKNKETYKSTSPENSLAYDNLTVSDLVNKDTDGDGILDWEEGLYGLDSTKKETTPGIPDSSVINKLKKDQLGSVDATTTNGGKGDTENLTQTEKFSRELFATVAAASQNGTMDQATVDTLSAGLAEKIKNPAVRKVFLISDIKEISDDRPQAFSDYNNDLDNIYTKYSMNNNVLDILQKFVADGENVDVNALLELDPIIQQLDKIVDALAKMSVPQSISELHLNLLNAFERIVENIKDMRLFSTDAILSIGAINKYEENADALVSAMNALNTEVKQKSNN